MTRIIRHRGISTMTPLQQLARTNAALEEKKAVNEFGKLAQFILASGGITKAAYQIETQGSKVGLLGPKLASIIQADGAGEINRAALLKTKIGCRRSGTLSSFADYSTICKRVCPSSLVNAGAYDAMLSSMVPIPSYEWHRWCRVRFLLRRIATLKAVPSLFRD